MNKGNKMEYLKLAPKEVLIKLIRNQQEIIQLQGGVIKLLKEINELKNLKIKNSQKIILDQIKVIEVLRVNL